MSGEVLNTGSSRPDKDRIMRILRDNEDTLRRRFGVSFLALFGSASRDESSRESDIDLLVDFDRSISFFGLCELEDYLSGLLDGAKIDLALKRAVIEELKDIIFGEAIDVIK